MIWCVVSLFRVSDVAFALGKVKLVGFHGGVQGFNS